MTEKEFLQFWEIYDQSFPKTEKRSLKDQKKLLKNKEYKVLLYHEREEVIGFITVWKLETFNFIEHFAIRKDYRGKGIGGKILEDIKIKSKNPLILEVELPKETMAKRRIDFYKRAGFYYNHYPYIQPPYQKEEKPIRLNIMSYPNAISKTTFNTVKDKLYSQVYNLNRGNKEVARLEK